MLYKIEDIRSDHNEGICAVIERVGAECGAIAESKGYGSCYLDTLSSMKSAISLYKKLGFQICRQLEGTHSGCDVGMIKYF